MKERVSIVTLSLALPSSPKKKKKKNVKGEKKCNKEIIKKQKDPKKKGSAHMQSNSIGKDALQNALASGSNGSPGAPTIHKRKIEPKQVSW